MQGCYTLMAAGDVYRVTVLRIAHSAWCSHPYIGVRAALPHSRVISRMKSDGMYKHGT